MGKPVDRPVLKDEKAICLIMPDLSIYYHLQIIGLMSHNKIGCPELLVRELQEFFAITIWTVY